MIEAEAQLKAGQAAAALATLNAARTTVTGLTPLADAGTDPARVGSPAQPALLALVRGLSQRKEFRAAL
jgi:hypothetical protein